MSIGGAELFSANLANRLSAAGNSVGFLVFQEKRKEALSRLAKEKVDIFFARRRHKLGFLFIVNISKVIKLFKPDLILSLSEFAYFFTEFTKRLSKLKIPHCLGFSGFQPSSVIDSIITVISRLWGAHYIFISSRQAEFYSQRYKLPKQKSFLIYNGVDIDMFSPQAVEVKNIFTITQVANLRPVKDQLTLLRSLAKLDERFKEWKLVLIGRGNDKVLCKLKRYLDKINLTEKVVIQEALNHTEVKRVLSRSDVFVLTSLSEGLPIAALEAMSMGLPCILTNVGGCPEIVENSYNGYLVRPKDYQAIAERILGLHNQPALVARIGNAARQTVKEKFNIVSSAGRYLEAFRKIKDEYASEN